MESKSQSMSAATQNSKDINAPVEQVYNAFINPKALESWQAPGDMTAKVHNFDLTVGGGYKMSLFYSESEQQMKGKTTDKEDRFTARFVELVPFKKIVQAVKFDTINPDFAEEMIMEITFQPIASGTRVTMLFRNIPGGIRPKDNEAGTISSLEKLGKYVEDSLR